MELIVKNEQGRVPVTVLKIIGSVDSFTYQELIEKVKEIRAAGSENLLLDLSETIYLSSAGIMALYSITKVMRGESASEFMDGWSALREMDKDSQKGRPKNLKLLKPQLRVRNILEMVGFDQFFDIFIDMDEALQAF